MESENQQMKIQLDTVSERDIDLLIIEEFVSDKSFAKLFTDAVGIDADYKIKEAIHSKNDSEYGESDIVFILDIMGRYHALHIEDKIDAVAMKNQYARYLKRAQKDIKNGEYDDYSVLIVAPQKYLDANTEAQKYDHRLRYEDISEYFKTKNDARSRYKLTLIERAIAEQKNGYQWKENADVVRFCTAMYDYQRKNFPDMTLGSVAWWPIYKTFYKGIDVWFKADRGFCDLTFNNCAPKQLHESLAARLSHRMNIVKTGKSAAIRILVNPIKFENDFESVIGDVHIALDAIHELLEFSKMLDF